jgi:hypothetical protein
VIRPVSDSGGWLLEPTPFWRLRDCAARVHCARGMSEDTTSFRIHGASATEVCVFLIGELARTCQLEIAWQQGLHVTTPDGRGMLISQISAITPTCTEIVVHELHAAFPDLARPDWVVRCERHSTRELQEDQYWVTAHGRRVYDGNLAPTEGALTDLRALLGEAAIVLDEGPAEAPLPVDPEDLPF